ncbi:apolipoprotein D-like [Neocloeon triangulifer]|uniref:apolipoprotein D-like n=1 Tax=Neocloeon triangulifer TaxID=2078957 RepID=UPI00286EE04E|nr:apolipoprotein D-like [Neocloeon triangulifer]
MKMLLWIVVSISASLAEAQVISPGGCPPLQVVQQFDLGAYLGRWYEFKKFYAIFQENGECATATYKENLNGTISVKNYLIDGKTGLSEIIYGHATVDSTTGEGKLRVNFPSAGAFDGAYWVIGTDYVNYAVVWSCTESGNVNIQFSWVLTRQRFPSLETLALAEQVIEANNLQKDKYVITNQHNCLVCRNRK